MSADDTVREQWMSGEHDLARLLGSMRPELRPGIMAFATVPFAAGLPGGIEPVMIFREGEGWTLILDEEAARKAGLAATFRCRMITLNVHSSLEAVGFIAAVATRLAGAGMGVNPVSGFHHDHLFVPEDRAEEAMELLRDLSSPRSRGEDVGEADR
jgi:hypothetical protein